MRIVGIDPSAASTGVVCLDGDLLIDHRIFAFPTYTGLKRAETIARCCENFCIDTVPDLVVIEDYGLNVRNVGTIVTLVEVGTLIRQAMRHAGKTYVTIRPTNLKKFTTGSGNANKHEMAKHVFDRWKFESDCDDVVDAYALARFGHELESNPTSLHKGVTYHES